MCAQGISKSSHFLERSYRAPLPVCPLFSSVLVMPKYRRWEALREAERQDDALLKDRGHKLYLCRLVICTITFQRFAIYGMTTVYTRCLHFTH